MTGEKTELYEILVPTVSNEGKPFRTRFHRVWDAKVREISGGLTIMKPIKGIWENEGTIFSERNIPVRIACNKSELMEILKMTKKYYSQVAIMAYKISEEVYIYE